MYYQTRVECTVKSLQNEQFVRFEASVNSEHSLNCGVPTSLFKAACHTAGELSLCCGEIGRAERDSTPVNHMQRTGYETSICDYECDVVCALI